MCAQFATRCIYGNGRDDESDKTGAISFPIYQTATFSHPDVGHEGFYYSRETNPTRKRVEDVVASLEGGVEALAFSSGMAAIAAVMELFEPGDHIICDSDLYGGTVRLFDTISKKNGLAFDYVNCTEDDVTRYVNDHTRAIFIETPTNPMMNIVDIEKMSGIAKQYDMMLIVDNTFLTPYFQQPFQHGADLVVHSGTKFLAGHNDTVAGFVVCRTDEYVERLRKIHVTVGSGLAPLDSWLVLRGIKTLPIRMERAQENAQAMVSYLQQRPEVKTVYYPGIPGTEDYEVCKKQASGFGAMLSFEVMSRDIALHVVRSTKLIPFAESLGGVETLITYPITQTHADMPATTCQEIGLTDCVLRLSMGIEDKQDLIDDIAQAFDSFAE